MPGCMVLQFDMVVGVPAAVCTGPVQRARAPATARPKVKGI